MPYEFPTRGLMNTDVLDTVEMNGDFLRAAEKYSGRLNMHDFSLAALASSQIASGAYHVVRQNLTRSVDPGWRHAIGDTPDTAPASSFRIQNDGSWQGLTAMSSTFTTGTGVLWITGWLQYVSHTWDSTPGNWPASVAEDPRAADVQFAIRLDGTIVGLSRTGKVDEAMRTFAAATPNSQRDAVNQPGPAPMRRDWAHSLGPPLFPVRLGAMVPVQAGSHTVEIVARRTMPLMYRPIRYAPDFIVVLSRKLFTLEIPSLPASAAASAGVEVDRFEPEDVLSAAAIGTDRISIIRSAYNDVQPGAVARGGFNHFHLPTVLLDQAQTTIIPGASQTSNDIYPAYDTSTIAGAKTNSLGWWPLDDGAGNNLSTFDTHAVAFNTSTQTSYILVFANVHVQAVERTVAGSSSYDRFGALALGYRRSDTGAQVIIGESEAHFCSFNQDLTDLAGDRDINADIPLFTVIDADPALAFNIEYFRVYGACGDTVASLNPATVQLRWLRGNIVALQIRA